MEIQVIQNKIYEIRGQKVMLDRDLAELYQVETRVLNQAVKRNIERFPLNLMFQLNDNEEKFLISQNVISSWGGNRKLPYAFTEQGVAMLSAVLKSPIAIKVSIDIMNAFVAMRRYLSAPIAPNLEITQLKNDIIELKEYIEEVFKDYNDINEDTAMQLELINQALAQLSQKQKLDSKNRTKIGYKK